MNRLTQARVEQHGPGQLRSGEIKYALLGWLLGLPLPVIIILLFVRGCDF